MSDDVSNIFQQPVTGAPTVVEGETFGEATIGNLPFVSSSAPGASPTTENLLQRQAAVDAQVAAEIEAANDARRSGIAVKTGQQGFDLVKDLRFARRALTLEEEEEIIARKLKERTETESAIRGAILSKAAAGALQTLFASPEEIPEAMPKPTLSSSVPLGS